MLVHQFQRIEITSRKRVLYITAALIEAKKKKKKKEKKLAHLKWKPLPPQDPTLTNVAIRRQYYKCTVKYIPGDMYITKTYLHNFDPLKPHFYIIKLGFTGIYIIFLICAQKHRLWVLVRTASARRF